MRNSLETRLGIFFALALFTGALMLEIVGSPDFFKPGYKVKAQFNSIQELKVGDPVKMAGVEIGKVRDIRLGDTKVEVEMKLHKDAKVKTDSKATVRFTGLMGQNYVAIDFGTSAAPLASPDAVLEAVEQADLNTLMAKLDSVASGVEGLTKNFSGESFGNLLGPFTDFLKENSPRLTAILGNIQVVSGQIAKGEGTIGKLVSDDSLYTKAVGAVDNLSKTTADLKPLFDDAKLTLDGAKKTIAGINEGQGSLGKLVKDEKLYAETATAMTNLKEILEKINKGQGSVGQLVNDETFFNNAKMTLQKVEKATEGLEDQGPLSVLGIAVNSLF
jgi:phospholipid/cholesterol/gamma-HCH transport system substrate-binding protein